MLTIRLHRIGKTNRPSFKIVVVDKRTAASSGKFHEQVGSLDRIDKQLKLNKEKIVHWMSKGAKPSGAVYNILVDQKIIEGKKAALHAQPKKKEGEDKPAAPAAQAKPEAQKPAQESADKAAAAPKEESKQEPKAEESKQEEAAKPAQKEEIAKDEGKED